MKQGEDRGEALDPADRLLRSKPAVINVGLHDFARNLEALEVSVVDVDWSPPAVTDPKIRSLLAKLGG